MLVKTLPVSQAGHQIHHITTCVHIPLTFQPNAAEDSVSETVVPVSQQMAQRTAGGESICNPIVTRMFRFRDASASEVSRDVPMKDSGVDRSPTNRESEKLSVASVARNMPSSRSEKHWMSTRCWSVT